MKDLLLLGAGQAQVEVLLDWARAPVADARLTLVSPSPVQIQSEMMSSVVAGHRSADEAAIDLEALARAAGAHFMLDRAVALDVARRRVFIESGQELGYDLLSLDTGAPVDRGAIPGARQQGLFLKPLSGFLRLWPQMLELGRQRPLHTVVIGAGPQAVELALAVRDRLGGDAHVTLVTGIGGLLPDQAPALQRRLARVLRRRGIPVQAEECVELAEGQAVLGNGARLVCDAPLLVCPPSAPPWLQGCGLHLSDEGFVLTRPTLQSVSHPEVWAAGEVAMCPELSPWPGLGPLYPSGAVLAANLRAVLEGRPALAEVARRRNLVRLGLGDRQAIASWGPWIGLGGWVWCWKDAADRRFAAGYRVVDLPSSDEAGDDSSGAPSG